MLETEKKITLDFPVELDGAKIDTLTVRRAKVKDHKNANMTSGGNQQDYELHLFASLTGQPLEIFDEMDYADYLKVQEAYSGFLSSKTTKK